MAVSPKDDEHLIVEKGHAPGVMVVMPASSAQEDARPASTNHKIESENGDILSGRNVAILIVVYVLILAGLLNLNRLAAFVWELDHVKVRMQHCLTEDCIIQGKLTMDPWSGKFNLKKDDGSVVTFTNEEVIQVSYPPPPEGSLQHYATKIMAR